jgi:sugar/nucleoside kinase (ribokinase family)
MDDILKKQVIEKLNQIESKDIAEFHVVVLPDFFVDHFLRFDQYLQTLQHLNQIQVQGGGNISGIPQNINQGGNAANTALALARLGVSSHLICRTDSFGLHLLDYFLGKNGVDLSLVKSDGKLAITTALEFEQDKVNIMLGDPGSVADFTYMLLNSHDLEVITQSDVVGVMNWNLNTCGTMLASEVFHHAKKAGATTFFDCGDPSPRKNDIPELFNQVLKNLDLDIFGLNENELHHLISSKGNSQEDIVSDAQSFKNKISARLDVHTAHFSCSVADTCTIVPTMKLSNIYRFTGAGDAWNAGNLFAELFGFTVEERLFFANAFAGYYISSPIARHADIKEILCFLGEK